MKITLDQQGVNGNICYGFLMVVVASQRLTSASELIMKMEQIEQTIEYYIKDYANYFGHYLHGFVDGGVDQATTLEEYITALKNSPSDEYFGDTLENYITDRQ